MSNDGDCKLAFGVSESDVLEVDFSKVSEVTTTWVEGGGVRTNFVEIRGAVRSGTVIYPSMHLQMESAPMAERVKTALAFLGVACDEARAQHGF